MIYSQLLLLTLASLSLALPANPKIISLPISKRTVHETSSLGIRSRPGSYLYVNITVGTPPQAFEVTLDTGSADTWVPLTADGQTHQGLYNPKDSSTYHYLNSKFDNNYVGGTGEGDWITESVDVGGVALSDFQIGAASTLESQTQGILGVSFKQQEGTTAYENFPLAAKDQGYIDHVAYSIFFEAPGSGDGTFLLGGIDHDKYTGDLTYFPATSPDGGPGFDLGSITANGTDIVFNRHAVFDTGSVAIALSEPQFSQVHEALGFTNYSAVQGQYFVDCDTKVSLKFNFGHLSIHADESSLVVPFSYFTGNPSDTYCVLATQNTNVYAATAAGMTLLGDPFLKNSYTVYDLEDKKIGLAQAVYTDKSDIQPITGVLG